MIEDFFNALHNFKSNKMRTFLSLLGIVIGVMSVIIITTLSQSLADSIAEEFKRFNLDVLNIEARWNPDTRKQFVVLNEEYRKTLKERIPQIKNIFYTYDFRAGVSRNNSIAGQKRINAVEPDRMESIGIKMDYGKFFDITDYAYGLQKAIIGKNIAEELFPEGRAVGKTITLQIASNSSKVPPYNFQFEVIGVLKDTQVFSNANPSESVYVPSLFYKKNLISVGKEYDDLWTAEVILYDTSEIEYVQSRVSAISSELAGGFPRPIWIWSAREELNSLNKIINLVGVVMTAVAAISLLVGGIGIMNIMLVTITERKKEIGIRKALGASNAAIRSQFLVESATLTLTGGFIGVVLGLIIGGSIARILLPMLAENPEDITIVTSFDIGGIIIAFVISVAIGIFFGLSPALKAAKLDPVKALAD